MVIVNNFLVTPSELYKQYISNDVRFELCSDDIIFHRYVLTGPIFNYFRSFELLFLPKYTK